MHAGNAGLLPGTKTVALAQGRPADLCKEAFPPWLQALTDLFLAEWDPRNGAGYPTAAQGSPHSSLTRASQQTQTSARRQMSPSTVAVMASRANKPTPSLFVQTQVSEVSGAHHDEQSFSSSYINHPPAAIVESSYPVPLINV